MHGRKLTLSAGLLALFCFGAARPVAAPITVANEISTKNVRSEESPLADVIVDSIRDADRSDAALMLASSFTDVTIPKGTASVEDVLKALEYRDDSVVVVKLTGAQIRKALEHGLRVYPQKHAGFLQVSGLTVTINPSAEPEKRVTEVRVGGSAASDSRTYTVAMPSPLASGAVGYFKIWDKKDVDHDTGRTVADAVTASLSGSKTIGAKGEDRLVFRK